MRRKFEYRVCAMQNGRITFVNGEWQGTIAPETEDPNQALDTCPVVWTYLQEAGEQGWELASAINQPLQDVQLQTLFLKREIVVAGNA
jgi:hypothetical protein